MLTTCHGMPRSSSTCASRWNSGSGSRSPWQKAGNKKDNDFINSLGGYNYQGVICGNRNPCTLGFAELCLTPQKEIMPADFCQGSSVVQFTNDVSFACNSAWVSSAHEVSRLTNNSSGVMRRPFRAWKYLWN